MTLKKLLQAVAARSKKKSSSENEKYDRVFGPAATFFFWAAGILVVGIGIYLTVNHETAIGYQRGRYGTPGGINSISGPAVIVIGCAFFLFPLYDLIQITRRRL